MSANQNSVIECTSDDKFRQELNNAGDRLVVVDFTATWCNPCRQMAPMFASLSNRYKESAVFLSVDIDKCQNKDKVDEIVGATQSATLEAKIKQHSGGSGGTIIERTSPVDGFVNLYSAINLSNSECLNESDDHPFKNALTKNLLYLQSDCDDQLLLYIAFNQPVRLHSLVIDAPDNGKAPKIVKLFVNQTVSLDFDKADSKPPTQELILNHENVMEGGIINLRYVKFQNVENITIFVKNNQGGDEITVINYLAFIGDLINKTDMSSFKRVAGKAGESH